MRTRNRAGKESRKREKRKGDGNWTEWFQRDFLSLKFCDLIGKEKMEKYQKVYIKSSHLLKNKIQNYLCLLKGSHNLFYFKIQFICYTANSFKYLYAYVSLFKSCDSNFVTASFLHHDHTSLIQTHSRLFPMQQSAWFNWIKVTEQSEKEDCLTLLIP